MDNEFMQALVKEGIKQAKVMRKQVLFAMLPILIGALVLSFIIGFILGAIIF